MDLLNTGEGTVTKTRGTHLRWTCDRQRPPTRAIAEENQQTRDGQAQSRSVDVAGRRRPRTPPRMTPQTHAENIEVSTSRGHIVKEAAGRPGQRHRNYYVLALRSINQPHLPGHVLGRGRHEGSGVPPATKARTAGQGPGRRRQTSVSPPYRSIAEQVRRGARRRHGHHRQTVEVFVAGTPLVGQPAVAFCRRSILASTAGHPRQQPTSVNPAMPSSEQGRHQSAPSSRPSSTTHQTR